MYTSVHKSSHRIKYRLITDIHTVIHVYIRTYTHMHILSHNVCMAMWQWFICGGQRSLITQLIYLFIQHAHGVHGNRRWPKHCGHSQFVHASFVWGCGYGELQQEPLLQLSIEQDFKEIAEGENESSWMDQGRGARGWTCVSELVKEAKGLEKCGLVLNSSHYIEWDLYLWQRYV